jgi:hypothetical protein
MKLMDLHFWHCLRPECCAALPTVRAQRLIAAAPPKALGATIVAA